MGYARTSSVTETNRWMSYSCSEINESTKETRKARNTPLQYIFFKKKKLKVDGTSKIYYKLSLMEEENGGYIQNQIGLSKTI